jgi:hypothetical protein
MPLFFRFSAFSLLLLLKFQIFAQMTIHQGTLPDHGKFANRIGLFFGTSLVPTHLGHHMSKDYVYVPTYGFEIGTSLIK